MRGLILAITLLWIAPAFAQNPTTAYPAPWTQIGNSVPMTVTTATSNVKLGWAGVSPRPPSAPPSAWICNTGANDSYVRMGNSSVTVSITNGFFIKASGCSLVSVAGFDYVAAITPTGATSLVISTGTGNPLASRGGSGSGPTVDTLTADDGATILTADDSTTGLLAR